MKKSFKGHQKSSQVPVILPIGVAGFGLKATIDPSTIPASAWTHHHGKTAAGQQVNSLQSIKIGESILLRKDAQSVTYSTPVADFEVAAVQVLTGAGYQVNASAAA